jgi:hypothetical protein
MNWEFEQYDDKYPIEREFHQHNELVIPLFRCIHNSLHLALLAPPKPSREEMIECVDFINQVPKELQKGSLWGAERAMEYFVYAGAERPYREEVAHEIRHNYAAQIAIMETGIYPNPRPRKGKRHARK